MFRVLYIKTLFQSKGFDKYLSNLPQKLKSRSSKALKKNQSTIGLHIFTLKTFCLQKTWFLIEKSEFSVFSFFNSSKSTANQTFQNRTSYSSVATNSFKRSLKTFFCKKMESCCIIRFVYPGWWTCTSDNASSQRPCQLQNLRFGSYISNEKDMTQYDPLNNDCWRTPSDGSEPNQNFSLQAQPE